MGVLPKTKDWTWHWQYTDYDESYIQKNYRHIEEGTGRRYRLGDITAPGGADPKKRNPHYNFLGVTRYWRYSEDRMNELFNEGRIIQTAPGRVPQYKRYLDEMKGVSIQNDWTDILPLHASHSEKLGYPTQKPVALLERILAASSNPGDVVLDPFCGCGTTVHAAEKLGRQWVGIDVTHIAIGLIEKRLRDAFPAVAFTTHGVPQDLSGARDLARRGRADGRYYFEFEKWALSLIGAQPGNLSKRGADKGIDGNIYFGKTARAIVSVKAGDNVSVAMIRDLRGVIERERAEIGVFLTLTPPKKTMTAEAAAAGLYEAEGFEPVPRIQIVTVEDALEWRDRAVRIPLKRSDIHKKAAREEDATRQGSLDL